jgi:phenylalanyl-tRNA synthetase beta subunit
MYLNKLRNSATFKKQEPMPQPVSQPVSENNTNVSTEVLETEMIDPEILQDFQKLDINILSINKFINKYNTATGSKNLITKLEQFKEKYYKNQFTSVHHDIDELVNGIDDNIKRIRLKILKLQYGNINKASGNVLEKEDVENILKNLGNKLNDLVQSGGYDSNYEYKYLKYKTKYMKIKKNNNY